MKKVSVVDLFCGVGGMTHGFVQEGFDVAAGIDIDRSCKYAYETNNNAAFLNMDVNILTLKEIIALYPKNSIRVMVGCAPCQPFSKYSQGRLAEARDKKWRLVGRFAELIREVRPEVLSMENVPELKDHRIFADFLKNLTKTGYQFTYSLVNCVDYGVPQRRIRLVLLASRLGPVQLIPKTHQAHARRTVAHAIRHLPPIQAGQVSEADRLHRASGLSELNVTRIESTPPGGGWKDWPEALLLECHKRSSGRTYRSVYGRMVWDEPAPTITTQFHGLGNGRFGHPEQHRAISLREAALLQTFPKKYKFVDGQSDVVVSVVARHIGNAVPPRLGRIIARSIRVHLEELHGSKIAL